MQSSSPVFCCKLLPLPFASLPPKLCPYSPASQGSQGIMLGQCPLLSQSPSKLMTINNSTIGQDIFTFPQQELMMNGDYTLWTTLPLESQLLSWCEANGEVRVIERKEGQVPKPLPLCDMQHKQQSNRTQAQETDRRRTWGTSKRAYCPCKQMWTCFSMLCCFTKLKTSLCDTPFLCMYL